MGVSEASEYLAKNTSSAIPVGKIIAHCDLYARHKAYMQFSLIGELMAKARKVTVVTLKVSNATLLSRVRSRIYRHLSKLVSAPREPLKDTKSSHIKGILNSFNKLLNYTLGGDERIYTQWFSVLDTLPDIDHWIFNNELPESIRLDIYDKGRDNNPAPRSGISLVLNKLGIAIVSVLFGRSRSFFRKTSPSSTQRQRKPSGKRSVT